MQDEKTFVANPSAQPPLHEGSPNAAQATPVPVTSFETAPSSNINSDASSDPASPDSFVRDPHKLIAYIVPFPAPTHLPTNTPQPPVRFLIYTPPPPPLLKPTSESEKEKTSHKIQRKWQQEVREAKESTAKVASWKGIKSRVTKGVSWAVNHTTSADLDFVTRIPKDGETLTDGTTTPDSDLHANDGVHEEETTRRTVKLEEMVLIYPPSMNLSPEQLREEFINSLMRTKSKAQKDAVIATGLLPVAAALDWALIFVGWIFGGALEVDGVWMASSIRGAKTARSVTKRLSSSTKSGDPHSSEDSLKLSFLPSHRADTLETYLLGQCIARDRGMFNQSHNGLPSEEDVMQSIGWQLSGVYQDKNWEDESWERDQVIEDLKSTMGKAAKAWDKWVIAYEKNPEKTIKK